MPAGGRGFGGSHERRRLGVSRFCFFLGVEYQRGAETGHDNAHVEFPAGEMLGQAEVES